MRHEVFRHHLLAARSPQTRQRFIEAYLALRQRHHRLQIQIHAVGVDRLADHRHHVCGFERLEAAGRSRKGFVRHDHRSRDRGRLAIAGRCYRSLGARNQRGLMHRDSFRQLLDQVAELVDFRGDRLDRGTHAVHCAIHLGLGGGEIALHLRHMLGEIGREAGKISDLLAHVCAIAQALCHGIIHRHAGESCQTDDSGFRAA